MGQLHESIRAGFVNQHEVLKSTPRGPRIAGSADRLIRCVSGGNLARASQEEARNQGSGRERACVSKPKLVSRWEGQAF